MRLLIVGMGFVSLLGINALAVGAPPPMDHAEFTQTLDEISNWGRWGDDDELGTLNTITPTVRAQAASLVKEGTTVSLALPLNKIADAINQKPFEHEVFIFGGDESFDMDPGDIPQAAGDVFKIDYHGFGHSHMDALPHFAYGGKMYNGFPFEMNADEGFSKLGVENIAEVGVFTRGVLVDMPKFLGIDFLEPGTAITASDLEAWEKASGVRVRAGDALLVRTGRWIKVAQDGQWNFIQQAAGMHASVARWLKERDVAVIGCDGVSDVMPSGVTGRFNPLHELVLIGLGMPIFDNLDLESLAEKASSTGRATFLFVAIPLRVSGATGSPLNPLAVF
ncbi:MAG: cyclase family protein [Pseudomonadales bacterium]|nr:cyclase family protein [Pseudomonadales bacterium]